MSDDKLESGEVPLKFAEWLLTMGCLAEKVPSKEKITLMCRGQYYMVWRSLMEHVYPRNLIREKRLQVFCDDLKVCKKNNAFCQNAVVPEELLLWQQQKELKGKVCDTENRLKQSQQTLQQLIDKIENKTSQCNISRQSILDLQRRVWLLQQVADELKLKKDNLEETRKIANSLCHVRNESEIQSKIDKCFAVLRNQDSQISNATSLSILTTANPVASSSAVSTINGVIDNEEEILSLVRCGDAVWTQLRERRTGLASKLAAANAGSIQCCTRDYRTSPQSVVAHTASVHCTLALEAVKNRLHIKQIRDRLANAINDFNQTNLSGEACELLVQRCERVRTEARVQSLRALLHELNTRSGVFKTNGEDVKDRQTTIRPIVHIDKAIESKRDELQRLLGCITMTERKIHNVKECLLTVFNNFRNDLPINENYVNKGIQLDFPKESISTLRQFYEGRREKCRNKLDLSMDFDVSEPSFSDAIDSNARFVEELKIYLKKFNLEKNRKLVLESGEKIWIFQTLKSLTTRLHSLWLSEDVSCSPLCPSIGLGSLRLLAAEVVNKDELVSAVRELNVTGIKNNIPIDINIIKEQEKQSVDKIKKRISSNLATLQQTYKTLEHGKENLKFWADNDMKKYISNNRTIDGKTYKDLESSYLENINV